MIARKIKEMHDSEQNPAGENEMNIHPCSCLDEVCVCVGGGGSKESQRSVPPEYAIDGAPGRVKTLSIVASGKVGEVGRSSSTNWNCTGYPTENWVQHTVSCMARGGGE